MTGSGGGAGDRSTGSGHSAAIAAPLAAALSRAATRFGTPVYVTDLAAVDAAADELRAAFPEPSLRHYAVAANPLSAIVARVGRLGMGASVGSLGEWRLALDAGIPNAAIVLSGRAKGDAELRRAVRAAAGGTPPRWVTAESEAEAATLERLASRAGLGRDGRPPIDALLRVRSAGDDDLGQRLLPAMAASPSVRWRGLALPAATPLNTVDAWRDAARRTLALLALLGGTIESLDTIDLGGGFPVPGGVNSVPGPARFAGELAALLEARPPDRRPTRVAISSGRFVVARAGWLVARVLHVEERAVSEPETPPSPVDLALNESAERRGHSLSPLRIVGPDERATAPRVDRLVGLDAGLPDILETVLLRETPPIAALTSLGRQVTGAGTFSGPQRTPARVTGPTGLPLDDLGEHRLPPLRRGDLVAIGHAGGYASAMASTFGGRPRRPEVLLDAAGSLVVARRRGDARSLR